MVQPWSTGAASVPSLITPTCFLFKFFILWLASGVWLAVGRNWTGQQSLTGLIQTDRQSFTLMLVCLLALFFWPAWSGQREETPRRAWWENAMPSEKNGWGGIKPVALYVKKCQFVYIFTKWWKNRLHWVGIGWKQIMRSLINLLPVNIQACFFQRGDIRGGYNLKHLHACTTLNTFCISVCGVKLWGRLVREIRQCPTRSKFKQQSNQMVKKESKTGTVQRKIT